jgi:hypothetical protein
MARGECPSDALEGKAVLDVGVLGKVERIAVAGKPTPGDLPEGYEAGCHEEEGDDEQSFS